MVQDKKFELINLRKVLNIIDKQLKNHKIIRETYLSNVINTQKNMWEDVKITNQNNFDVDALSRSNSYQAQINYEGQKVLEVNRLSKVLIKMKNSPYFAKINFLETGESEIQQIYIGVSTLIDEETDDIIVYDWRAPISSMFYDYELGNTKYTCPNCEITGTIKLKRQFKIDNGKLIYMFDTNLKIDDEILKEVLSKNVNSKMKNIVASIQREQNMVIRDLQHKLLIVEGPAGCGKTSIALHRIAYLLYKFRRKINSNNIVIFTPNVIFNDYINDVLPELGEENVNITTFSEYSRVMLPNITFIETFNNQMEYILTNNLRKEYELIIDCIKYKSSKDFLLLLKNYVDYLNSEAFKFEDIIYREKTIIKKEDIQNLYYNEFTYLPIVNRLNKIKNRIIYLIKPYKDNRYEEIKKDIINTRPDIINEDELKEVAEEKLYKEYYPIENKIKNMTQINALKLYKSLLRNKKIIDKFSNNKLPQNINQILKLSIDNIEKRTILYEDVTAILYLQCLIGDIPINDSIKHVVIDEVQDYSLMQLEIIKKLFPASKFTLVGDFNQSINPYMSSHSSKDIINILNIEKSLVIKLTKTYRSTKQITKFSKNILKTNNNIVNVDREGSEPQLFKATSKHIMNNKIMEDIKCYKNKGYKSIAVICKNYKQSEEVYAEIKDKININIISDEDEEFQSDIVILPSYVSKGLEFDVVLIYDANSSNYFMENQRKLFYTMCTRALHILNIYYTDNLTPFIKNQTNLVNLD